MKKFLALLIITILILIPSAAFAEEADQSNAEGQPDLSSLSGDFDITAIYDYISGIKVGPLFLPMDSSTLYNTTKLQLLGLSLSFTVETAQSLFASAGLEILTQKYFDKTPDDVSNTCAYTIGKGKVFAGIFSRDALVVSIRGTSDSEWYSNFNFCPSRSESSLFAENFLFCAEDVFMDLKDYIDAEDNPIVIICGYSRGAACANLLGVLVNEYVSPDNVYVYTYATPGTVREGTELENTDNIFNFINPSDMVPKLPLNAWGFKRAGTDIILPVKDQELYDKVISYFDTFSELSPDIDSYYNKKLSLTGTEEGITPYELMLLMSELLVEASNMMKDKKLEDVEIPDISSFSQLADDSGLKPLMEIYQELTADDLALGKEIFMQHMPNTYYELIMYED